MADLEKLIGVVGLDDSMRVEQLERLEDARALGPDLVDTDASFRAVLPMGEHHAQLFKVQADLWRKLGRGPGAVAQALHHRLLTI